MKDWLKKIVNGIPNEYIDDVFAILVILVTIIFIIVASGTIVIMAGIFAMTSMCYFWYKKFGEKISDWAKK